MLIINTLGIVNRKNNKKVNHIFEKLINVKGSSIIKKYFSSHCDYYWLYNWDFFFFFYNSRIEILTYDFMYIRHIWFQSCDMIIHVKLEELSCSFCIHRKSYRENKSLHTSLTLFHKCYLVIILTPPSSL